MPISIKTPIEISYTNENSEHKGTINFRYDGNIDSEITNAITEESSGNLSVSNNLNVLGTLRGIKTYEETPNVDDFNDGEVVFISDSDATDEGSNSGSSSTISWSDIEDKPTKLSEFENDLTYSEPTLYEGVDLTVKFADEISGFDDEWAWIKDRINNANYEGLRVCDYIPFTTEDSNGTQYTLNAQIAGIDTYYRTNYPTITGHHIDFISKELYPSRTWTVGTTTYTTVWNETNNNNGTSEEQSPWKASYLCSLLNDVMFYYLPETLQDKIIDKDWLLEYRYSSSGTLTDSNSWGWGTLGKLWLPTETEVYGTCVWGTVGYSVGTSIQYPVFANRSKMKLVNDVCGSWWLMTPHSGSSIYACSVNNSGGGAATTNTAYSGGLYIPLCFRL